MCRNLTVFCTIISIVLLTALPFYAAGNASIQGSVKDAQTGDPLPGTNIIIVGTGMGAASDINGNYFIDNVPPGTYKLRATYIGYEPEEVTIKLTSGMHLEQNFKLKGVGVQGKTVVVTAQASGQSQAINQQLSSDQIANVVSAAKIQELPDANAAESLGRLPGISVLRSGGEANEVVVRGLAPKYNRILVNGVELNSSNPNDQSVDLSMISSNMLAGMEVKKTVTPDMDANVIGGTVNLELREAQVSKSKLPIYGLLLQGGYNALSNAYNKTNNYKYVASAEDRFFNEKFGVFAQFDVEKKNLTSNQLGATYAPKGNSTIEYITSSLNLDNIPRERQRYDGTVVLDYRLPAGTIKLSNFLSTGNTDVIDRGESYSIPTNTHSYTLSYSNQKLSVITNALHFKYQLPIFNLDVLLSHAYTETKNPNDWNVTFQQGSAGLGVFTNVSNLNPQSIPNAANNDASKTFLQSLQSLNSFSGARSLSAQINLSTNLNITDYITSIIKFGGMYRYQNRHYDYFQTRGDGIGLQSAGFTDSLIASRFPSTKKYAGGNNTQIPMGPYIDPNYNYGKFLEGNYPMVYPLNFAMLSDITNFLLQNVDLVQRNNAIAYSRDAVASTMNNYDGKENQSAGYIMATINIGPDITLIPGVRYQNLQTSYTGSQGIQTVTSSTGGAYSHYDTTVTINHGYWLPDVALKYKPLSWMDVRLSYTHTLAYPDFNAIIPKINIPAAVGGYITWNNPLLAPSRSTNYDIYFSFYNNTIGLLTIGGYLKQIDDLIYPWTFHISGKDVQNYFPQRYTAPSNANYYVNTFINDHNRATDYGFEFEWQTHFWYLPQPFNGIVLSANYTHVYSKETYPFVSLERIGRVTMYVDTSFTDRLLYQPDNIANLSLGYDYKGFSIRVSLIYQDNIFSGPNFWPQLRSNTSSYTRWDLAVKQDLPWFGVQLFGDINNLNSEKDVEVIQAITGVPQSEQDYGLTADLGLRVKF